MKQHLFCLKEKDIVKEETFKKFLLFWEIEKKENIIDPDKNLEEDLSKKATKESPDKIVIYCLVWDTQRI